MRDYIPDNDATIRLANDYIACETEGKEAIREKFICHIDNIVHGMIEEEDLLCILLQRAEQLSEANAELFACYSNLISEFSKTVKERTKFFDEESYCEEGKVFLMVLDDGDQDYWNEYVVHKVELAPGKGLIKYSIIAHYAVVGDWGDAEEWSALLTKTVKRNIPQDCFDDEVALRQRFINDLSRAEFISLMNEGKQPDAPELVDDKTICQEDYKGYFTALGFEVDS